MGPVYLDHNATTPLLPAVWEAMWPYWLEAANPASSHQAGRRARRALEDARERTAALLDAHPDDVIFTSGATEANNLALLGLAGDPPGHLLVSSVEHPCVLGPARRLAELGFVLDLLPVDPVGSVPASVLDPALRIDTRLLAVMLANHETGAVQPIPELAARAAERGIPFHCDAAAAAGKLPVGFRQLGVTSLTISAHKFHGPVGVGALLVRRAARLRPQLWGGHQQQGRRPGTEPVALAVGLAAALDLAVSESEVRSAQVRRLRALFLEQLQTRAAPVVLNGPAEGGVPHTLNVSFPGCRADVLLMSLDLAGVACSTGSACSSGSLLPSPVLRAMGLPDAVLHSAMRFSFSHLLSEGAVADAAERVNLVVRRLRQTPAD
jgi:cysteine desulfurase